MRAPIAFFALTFVASPVFAADLPSPRPWLEKKVEEGRKLAEKESKSKDVESWNAKSKALIDDMLDWPEMTKRSLGRQWSKIDDKQKKEFSAILREMIETSYRSKLKIASKGDVKKPKKIEIKWLEEEVSGKKGKVSARVQADKQVAILEFSTIWHDGRWHVYDVAIDDVSTVRTYRSQFRKLIEKEGFEELLSRMRKKIEDIRAGRGELGP